MANQSRELPDDTLIAVSEIRPMAEGSVAMTSSGAAVVLGSLHEQITTLCVRPVDRADLFEVLTDVSGFPADHVAAAIDDLLQAGILRQLDR
ncbi:hypothetical protein BH10ACT3_BH10ACT3_19280 [soil metagenome]